MKLSRFVCIVLFIHFNVFAAESQREDPLQSLEPKVGSWTFSGMVSNEGGERYGYFFQLQKQGINFHTKTALINGQTNKLVFFYEGDEVISEANPLNWHVGRSFIRYNSINDSWVFGVKSKDNQGFNFKVDMLKQVNTDKDTLFLRPGVEMQTRQTSLLNGHITLDGEKSEQFVTGNTAWFSKLRFSKDQKTAHEISTTFCRLNNNDGFYSAHLKEEDAIQGAVAGWRDATGNRVRMSQFVSIKSLDNDQFLLSLSWPKMELKLFNTLKASADIAGSVTASIAGFSKDKAHDFCYVAEQSFAKSEST